MKQEKVANRQDGFSTLELLVAMALLSLLLVGILGVYANNVTAYVSGQHRIELQQNGRIAIARLMRELQLAGFDLSGTIDLQGTPTAVQAAAASSLTFLTDTNHDGVLDQITYRQNGTTLVREISSWNGSSFPTATSSIVADNIDTLAFIYYDDAQPNNQTISAPVSSSNWKDIHRVTVSLLLSAQVVGGADHTFPLVVDVKLRNAG